MNIETQEICKAYKEAYEAWKWALDICLKNSSEK